MTAARACVIVGRPNAGKTMLLLQLARHCGLRCAELELVDPDGRSRRRVVTTARPGAPWVTPVPHETRRLQRLQLALAGRGRPPWTLCDTTGLPDGIHPDPEVRRAVAQTLRALREAALIIHVVDAAALGDGDADAPLPRVDAELWRLAAGHDRYLAVANKMDLPWARRGYERLRRQLPAPPLPVSALRGTGLAELRTALARRA